MLGLWSWLIGSRLGRIVGGVAAVLAALAVAFWRGAAAARRERERQDMRDHIETRRRMDDALEDVPDDVAAARGWLRDRAKRRDGDM